MLQNPLARFQTKIKCGGRKWNTMHFSIFSINTFTDQEWSYGDEDPKLFNRDKLDCRQWARVCKEAGMKGIIITAKHHAGFCLWPSKYTEFSVKNSPWKNGKEDILRELSDACKKYGDHGWNDGGYSGVLDVAGYNYGQRGMQYVKDHEKYPRRKMFVNSEKSLPFC